MRVIAATPTAKVKRYQTTISNISGHNSTLMIPIDSEYDFLLVICIDLRSRWNRCRAISHYSGDSRPCSKRTAPRSIQPAALGRRGRRAYKRLRLSHFNIGDAMRRNDGL